MRIIVKEKFDYPVNLMEGDTFELNVEYKDENGNVLTKTKVLSVPIGRTMTLTEGAIFELDERELEQFDLKDGIGGWVGEAIVKDTP